MTGFFGSLLGLVNRLARGLEVGESV